MAVHSVIIWSNVISTKPEFNKKASNYFSGVTVDVIEDPWVLGSVIGSVVNCNDFVNFKLVNYSNMLEELAKHIKVSSHKMYKSLSNRLPYKLTSNARTTPNLDSILREAEKLVYDNIIPSILNHTSNNDRERKVFSFPVIEGGLGILLPEKQGKGKWKIYSDLWAVTEA